ncbi:hypothetical protein EAI_09319 [Harpegnathos saltator]|uniref:Uncharacterized protein n=1 Tax=Harpegnathos saltator TaxID=610380 RepID=E2B3U2_HARSA|nr:hypothetical protein EAI_09319 [Harpegnathos saltator]
MTRTRTRTPRTPRTTRRDGRGRSSYLSRDGAVARRRDVAVLGSIYDGARERLAQHTAERLVDSVARGRVRITFLWPQSQHHVVVGLALRSDSGSGSGSGSDGTRASSRQHERVLTGAGSPAATYSARGRGIRAGLVTPTGEARASLTNTS